MFRKLIILVVLNVLACITHLHAGFNEKLQVLIQQDPPKWMLQQIEGDLAIFREKGVSLDSLDRTIHSPGNEYSVKYKIQGQKISYMAHADGPFLKERRDRILYALNKLASAVPLPNLEVIINPLDTADFHTDSNLAPVLVFSKNKYINNQVLIPNPDALNHYGDLEEKIKTSSKRWSWKSKKKQAFWRGATTGGTFHGEAWYQLARAKLVLISLQHPDLIDAKFYKLVQGAEANEAMLAMPELMGNEITPSDSLKYRYLIDVDGNTCSWQRMYWILLSNSVLLKQVTDNIEWFYGALIPHKHFVPLKHDLTNLIQKVNWTKRNDQAAHKIAKRATTFAKKNLSDEMIYLYLYWVLVRYSELQTF